MGACYFVYMRTHCLMFERRSHFVISLVKFYLTYFHDYDHEHGYDD